MLRQILVIEDSKLQRALDSHVLAAEDQIILQAASLAEARHFINSQMVHVVVLDVKLPDGNGLEFVAELKQALPKAEIIVFTSRSQ